MTGMVDRPTLIAALDELLGAGGADADGVVLVVLVDIDRFSELNNALGYRVGDALLAQVGSRLAAAVADSDCVARLGADQFAVMLLPSLIRRSAGATSSPC
jgi:diguanylate cyclase (GGDEF)-like protein